MRHSLVGLGFVIALAAAGSALAQDAKLPDGMTVENGKYFDAEGNPTYYVAPDGTVDWYTYSGFRRFHSECHVCHGPDGLGSSYAPNLTESLKHLDYSQFMEVVVNGRKNIGSGKESVMPSFGDNQNVMCYIDDLYDYLKARADGAIGRGRPMKRQDKPAQAKADEDACFGRT